MRTKAILFDLDGVILDSEKVYRRFWLQAAEELGLPLQEETVLELRSCDASIARPGVQSFLEKCRDLPVRKVIVTSSTPEEKMPALERLGIGQYFDGFVSVKEVKRGKPFPDVYLFACSRLGLEPGECAAIEDSPNGVRSAYGAGVKVIMVPDLTGPTDELRRMCRVADRIGEVTDYIT